MAIPRRPPSMRRAVRRRDTPAATEVPPPPKRQSVVAWTATSTVPAGDKGTGAAALCNRRRIGRQYRQIVKDRRAPSQRRMWRHHIHVMEQAGDRRGRRVETAP